MQVSWTCRHSDRIQRPHGSGIRNHRVQRKRDKENNNDSSSQNHSPTTNSVMTPEEEFQDHDNPDFGPRLVGAGLAMLSLILFVAWLILKQ